MELKPPAAQSEKSIRQPIKGAAPVKHGLGVYIHWPYCLSKCPYCDFFSQVKKNVPQDQLISAYLEDLNFYYGLTSRQTVTSIFFGGGTPSLITPFNIERILDYIAAKWKMASDVEISLEANPNTHTPQLFSNLRQVGINRLSLGIQALDSNDLKMLGRTHSVKEALLAAEEVIKIFDNHSADLIYARPSQKLSLWQEELELITKLGFKHLSLYQLTIEEGTVFSKRDIKPLPEEESAQFYDFTNDLLNTRGYPRYEISNYAPREYQCRHNLLYWQGDDYIGIGPSAHGRIYEGAKFWATTHPRQLEELTSQQRAEELIIMGLRLVQGINKKNFKAVCGLSLEECINNRQLEMLISEGFVQNSSDYLAATSKGLSVLNYIIQALCL